MTDATSRFGYRACDGEGRVRAGQVAARGILEAAAALEHEGLAPLALWPAAARPPRARAWPAADVVELASRLGPVLTAAGDPVPALRAAADSARGRRVAGAFARLADELTAGRSWAEAGWRLGPELPPTVATLLTVGLAGDRWETPLGEFLEVERTALLGRRRLWAAMAYPLVVLAAFVITGSVLTSFLVPVVLASLHESASEEPVSLVTARGYYTLEPMRNFRFLSPLVQIMHLVGRHLPELGLISAVTLLALGMVWRRPAGRATLRQLSWEIPFWGRGARLAAMSGWCRRLGALVEAEVPLPRALATVARASQGEVLAAPGFRLAASVSAGHTLADALAGEPRFLPTAGPWLAWAEPRQSLARTCRVLSAWYARRAELGLESFAAQAPLVTYLLVGLMAAALVTSVLSPLVELIRYLG